MRTHSLPIIGQEHSSDDSPTRELGPASIPTASPRSVPTTASPSAGSSATDGPDENATAANSNATETESAATLPDSERRAILALCRAFLPAGKLLPAAGSATAAKVLEYLEDAGPYLRTGYRAALRAAMATARLRYGRALSDLRPEQVAALFEGILDGGFGRQGLVRALASPIKAAYFDSPDIYRLLGQRYQSNNVREEEVAARAAPADQPAYVVERTARAVDLAGADDLECDVVIIGSGAGGAVAAYELAAAGHAVVLLEEGYFFGRRDFGGSTLHMQRLLYRDMGATVAWGNTAIPVPAGCTVGGTTTVNSGTCYRIPDRVLEHWHDDLHLTDYTSDVMAPYFERVEEVLQVTPATKSLLGTAASAAARGAELLGLKHRPLRRNAPECDGQGVCCFGCPTDAKRSTNVSYVPKALQAGAQLVVGARAERVLIEHGRAVGVEALAREPGVPAEKSRKLTVRAKAVVVACGALYTPVLLQSDVGAMRALKRSGALGRHLTIHPAAGLLAVMPEVVNRGAAIPQSYAIEEFHEQGILMEGAFSPPELTALSLGWVGPRFVDAMEQFEHLACFGFMIEDTSTGTVRPGPGRRPLIHYTMNDHDVARVKRAVDLLSQVFFAAGAQRIFSPLRGFEELRSRTDLARLRRTEVTAADFQLTAYHPLGTARMGVSNERSVVNQDLAAHDLPGLYIFDGSVLPTSPAVNPQLTIMALSSRAAQRLAERLH